MSENQIKSSYWELLEPNPNKLGYQNHLVVGDLLYCIGGVNYAPGGNVSSETIDSLYSYDLKTNQWQKLKSLPQAVSGSASVYFDGKIYCIGGWQKDAAPQDNRLNTFYIYDIQANEWSKGADKPTGVCNHAVALCDKQIYCMGGMRNGATDSQCDLVEVYNIETNTWYTVSSMPAPMYMSGAAYVDGKIYVAGNSRSEAQFFIYDIATDKWDIGASRRGEYSAVTSNYNIYTAIVFEHYIYFFNEQSPEIYDLLKGQWAMGIRAYYSDSEIYSVTYGDYYLQEEKVYFSSVSNAARKGWNRVAYGFGEPRITIYNVNGAYYDLVGIFPLKTGDTYSLSAPHVEGTEYIGYQIDADAVVYDERTITIDDVQTEHTIFLIYQTTSEEAEYHTITEKFHDVFGNELQADATMLIEQNGIYTNTAPMLAGYTRIGYKIGDGTVEPGYTAVIEAVSDSHTVTFLYEEGDEEPSGENLIITEKYVGVEGTALRPDTKVTRKRGESYSATAPLISGYKRVGYQLDGGTLQPYHMVQLTNLQENHIITFVYEKGDEEMENNICCNNGQSEFEVDACFTLKFKVDCTEIKMKDCSNCCAEISCNNLEVKG